MFEGMEESNATEQDATASFEPCLLEKTRFNAEAEPAREFNTDQEEKKTKSPSAKDIAMVLGGLGVGLVANEVRKRTKEEEKEEWLVDETSATMTFIASFMILLSVF